MLASPTGETLASVGDPETFIFLRSAAKPIQLAAVLLSGVAETFRLSDEELAVMAASHSGEDRHVRTVQSALRKAGLSQSVLACGTHAPFDAETADRLIREGEPPTPIRHNCSGKHAGMVLFARAAGWPVEGYWRADHPVQSAVLDAIATATGVARDAIVLATDGCGVPTFGVPLRALAVAFARLADPSSLTDAAQAAALARVRDAMVAYPELVGGERRRFDTALMRAARGSLAAKPGAEGVQGIAVLAGSGARDGAPLGMAVVVEDGDGARRAGGVAASEALRQLGVLGARAVDELEAYAAPVIRDPRGDPSGSVRPAFSLV